MPGMHAATGKPLDGIAHVRQSIRDILTTRVGTRIGRRSYGSDLPALVDRPLTAATLADVYAATAEAIAAWEPRFRLSSVAASAAGADGRLTLTLEGLYVPDGGEARIEVAL